MVASDLIKLLLVSKEDGAHFPLMITFNSQDTVTGITSWHARPYAWCEGTESSQVRTSTDDRTVYFDSCVTHTAKKEYTAFGIQEYDDLIRFSLYTFSDREWIHGVELETVLYPD